MDIKIGKVVYHEDISDGKKPMEIVDISENKVQLEDSYYNEKFWVSKDGLVSSKKNKSWLSRSSWL